MKTLSKLLISLTFSSICLSATANVHKKCFTDDSVTDQPEFYISNWQTGQNGTMSKQKFLKLNILKIGDSSTPHANFQKYKMKKGDCILFNDAEVKKYHLLSENASWLTKLIRKAIPSYALNTENIQPSLLFKNNDQSKNFGFITNKQLGLTQEVPIEKSSSLELQNYIKGKKSDLVLLHATCPKNRNDYCKLNIIHKGEVINDTPYLVLNRSRRENGEGRIHFGGDTPQGIYTLWASMYTEKLVFGGVPRIDIDAVMPPINSKTYNENSFLLDKIIPTEMNNEYWVNEWALAYSMGRVFMRIHANSVDPEKESTFKVPSSGEMMRPTSGCLNMGKPESMIKLLNTLVSLGVFEKNDFFSQDSKTPLGWKVSKKIGNAYLIVQDVI